MIKHDAQPKVCLALCPPPLIASRIVSRLALLKVTDVFQPVTQDSLSQLSIWKSPKTSKIYLPQGERYQNSKDPLMCSCTICFHSGKQIFQNTMWKDTIISVCVCFSSCCHPPVGVAKKAAVFTPDYIILIRLQGIEEAVWHSQCFTSSNPA